MAIGLKHWIILVATGLLLVAAWALPVRDGAVRRPMLLPEERASYDLTGAIRREHGVLQATRWSDSLSALAVRDAVDGLALGAPEAPQVTPAGIDEWRRMLSDGLEALERRDDSVVLGVFAQPARHGSVPGVTLYPFFDRLTFVGAREGVPYCLQVFVSRPSIDNADLRTMARDGFGPCAPYARYGMPGAAMQEWLEGGGLVFGLRRGERESIAFGPFEDPRVPLFGLNRLVTFFEGVDAKRCLSGHADACSRFALEPLVGERGSRDHQYVNANSPAIFLGGSDGRLGPNSGAMFEDLELEFGVEAFERFWTSAEPPEAAFESAFGMGMGAWMLSWIDSELGVYRAGPATRAGSVLLSLLVLSALAALVSAAVSRRRVA